MRSRWVFTIGIFLTVILISIGIVVFKVSGSNSSVSIDGCDPYNVKIQKGESPNSVEISWLSKEKCSAYIIYGNEMKDLNLVGIDLKNDVKDINHFVVIDSVLSSKTYFFSIVSDGVTYGKDGLPLSFTPSSL